MFTILESFHAEMADLLVHFLHSEEVLLHGAFGQQPHRGVRTPAKALQNTR